MADDPTGDPNTNQPSGDVRQMREAIQRKDNRIAELEVERDTFKTAALAGVVHRAGYDPEAGPVKLVTEKFITDLTPEKLDPKAFTSFAKEWGVEPVPVTPTPATPAPSESPAPSQAPVTDPNAAAQQQQQTPATLQTTQQVAALQQPADALAAAAQAAQSPSTTDPQQAIAAAEAEGRWGDAFNLKIANLPSLPGQFGGQSGTGVNPQTNLPTHTPPEANQS